MTSPSDIAGLSERLRFDAVRCEVAYSKGVASNIEEAATAIDSLTARVKELEASPPLLDARSITELDELVRSLEDRALTAEQQRDEAYERAAKVAELAGCGNRACLSCYGNQIAVAIRRLASGPEGGSGEKP